MSVVAAKMKGNSSMKNSRFEREVVNTVFESRSLSKYSTTIGKLSYSSKLSVDLVFESLKEYPDVLDCLFNLNSYDKYTFLHSINVCTLSAAIGSSLGITGQQLTELGISAMLHDFGKVFVPKTILNKKSRLTNLEFEIIKTHVTKGYFFLVENLPLCDISLLGILHHHERRNGTGYPAGITGEDIDLFGRIISIADVYEAMTSDRPYRKAQSHLSALEFLLQDRGTCFDPALVDLFEAVSNKLVTCNSTRI